ncbi:gamma-secretase subunit Aph-1 [Syncephalastrum racemosum]|uniref:Gamma-secretase subunit Aph-1 n=1 Tax=Syncephalastrum racemosum TaxID=13706 RepID=A0A1X2HFQ3_SYNRA|nr:gamma-secretase subunit Aph-1 [Syncephalastrum racemosum]
MALPTFFGCLLIAYGPLLGIFFLVIAPRPQWTLLMVASGFFCLLAILISSVIWYFGRTTIFGTIAYSVTIQEVFRVAFWRLLKRTEVGFNLVASNPTSPLNRHKMAFAAGYGYALMSALISYISPLVDSIGPGVLMCPSCPGATLFFVYAFTTSFFSLLHLAWMMLAFDALNTISTVQGKLKLAWVFVSHFAASFASSLNSSDTIYLGCVYGYITCIGILAISTVLVTKSLTARR